MLKKFRPCAGAIVFNDKGQLLLCNRIDTLSDAWQFPQGGIEKNETPLEAAKRELMEETNVTSVIPVYSDTEPRRYFFPKEIKDKFSERGIFNDGQDIYFTLFYFCGKNEEINLETKEPEFRQYMWDSFDFAIKNIISFKKDVYIAVAKKFEPIIGQYLKNLS